VPSLTKKIIQLTSLNKDQLIEEKKKSREWAVKNHSLEATALRLWDKVYCNFFTGQKRNEILQTIDTLKRNKLENNR